MRPKYLEMSAWGPYKEQAIIDFEAFLKGALFLVTGPTGSGKTTIFDGICFALYGDTSGKEREKTTLRSDFAAPDASTYVKLIFTHNGLEYEVYRNPEYKRPKKRKNADGTPAYTTEKENAILKLPDGNVLEGVTPVNRKLQELLALDYSQFKQISMIAQGEFDKMLTAPSQEKTKIFRGIFGTEKYDLFTRLLKEKAAASYRKVSEYKNRMDEDLKIYAKGEPEIEELAQAVNIHYEAVQRAMTEKQSFYAEEFRSLTILLEEKEAILNGQYAAYNQALELKKKREALNNAKERLDKLEATREQYEEAKGRLKRAEEAQHISREYEEFIEAEKIGKKLADAELREKRKVEVAQAEYLQAERKEQAAYSLWQQADTAYKRASIGIVADMLKEGMPCPVCGSLEHPEPFQSDGSIPDLKEVEKLKKVYEKEKKIQTEVYGRVQACLEAHKRVCMEISEADEKLEKLKEIWSDKLKESTFQEEQEFLNARLKRDEVQELQKKTAKWEEMMTTARAVVEHMSDELDRIPVLDIEQMAAAYNQALTERNEVRERQQQVRFKELQMQNGLDSLRENRMQAEHHSKEYGIVKDLENMASGNNSRRLVFEQYVLSSYFEDILAAANIRFRHMTMDRYEMIRKTEVSDARTKDHLDITIVDYYTGKTRPVSTLSGGERFNASLSLALGMSDVIQAYQGGIQVEALFVDEGFGSLDEETLQAACDTLYQLTEGDKLVGIISHVESLKQRIDNRIEICKTNMGSTLKVITQI